MDEVKDEMSRWELLRAAADILDEEGYVSEARNLRSMARHREGREAVIEAAARTMAADHNPGVAWTAMGYGQKSFIAGARALADAGLLVTEVQA